MSSPQKQKGSSWERDVAKYLSELYDDHFVRVPNSGAFIGGSNSHRKQNLSENQIKGFKGDIIPPDSWAKFNAEAKNYADFPFHLVLSGECKQLNTWLDQLMSVSDEGDLNILFMKFNRKGRYVAVQCGLTWVTDNFTYYSSGKFGDWLIIEFNHFFKNNKDLLKAYSSTTDTKSTQIQSSDNLITLTIQ
jgi:hypothetical protein